MYRDRQGYGDAGARMWLARGRCGACGAAVARRAVWPKRAIATCNLCRRTTPLWAWRARGRAARLPALLLLVSVAGLVAVSASAPAERSEWATLEQALVAEASGERVRYHWETLALDAAGARLDPASVDGLPSWRFASHGTLIDPGTLAWAACADPPACPFEADAGSIVYFTPADPAMGLVTAFDPARGEAWLYAGDEWLPWDEPGAATRVRFEREVGPA